MTEKTRWHLFGAVLVLMALTACDPSTYFGARRGMATPATGETPTQEPTPAPAAPPLETAAAPDPDQRVRALEEQVQRLGALGLFLFYGASRLTGFPLPTPYGWAWEGREDVDVLGGFLALWEVLVFWAFLRR